VKILDVLNGKNCQAHDPPLVPGVPHVTSGERSIRTDRFPRTRILSIALRDQLTNSTILILRAMRRKAPKFGTGQDKTGKKAGKIREREDRGEKRNVTAFVESRKRINTSYKVCRLHNSPVLSRLQPDHYESLHMNE